MNNLSNRLNNLSESATLAMARMSRELKNKGINIISLSLGEPDFNTPKFIKEAAIDAIKNNYSHYTPVSGLSELKNAIALKFKRDNNLTYSTNQIIASTGAKQSIANVCLSILNPGDEVLLPCPYWVSYEEIIKLSEATSVKIPSTTENNFKVTAKQIKKHISNKTKMLIFSSPCNPSGTVYSEKELREIAKVLENYPKIIIVSDEIYEHINFRGNHFSFGSISSMKERTVTVNGVSKGFAMTGWRVGYIGAPKWIADACNKIQGQVTSATCAIAQKATEKALLENPKVVTQKMNETFLKRRDIIVDLLEKIKGIKCNKPEGAFYVFPDVSYYFGKKFNNETINNTTELCLYLLNQAHVACVAGDAFGNSECIRISYATSEEKIIEAMKRIKKYLELLS